MNEGNFGGAGLSLDCFYTSLAQLPSGSGISTYYHIVYLDWEKCVWANGIAWASFLWD